MDEKKVREAIDDFKELSGYMRETGYENYTGLLRIEKYSGEILGVAMCREGESPEQRLLNVEQEQKELKEAREQDAKQLTDLQLAVCEIYEMKAGV